MLKELIKKLYLLQNNKQVDNGVEIIIDNILEENDLIETEMIPQWFVAFLESAIQKQVSPKTKFIYEKGKGDVSNLISELESLINAEWNDYGEAVEVKFDNLGLKAIISTESNYYEIIKID
ncbi:hypothetical protein [Chryseobacterium luteum]|uniref:Uncharacterized protein n=1 Tax=Chryseobacterium luteum TaxID=421531 RepID=A0A085ZBA9_9FLAO|nr:hypothetical protein [Chryseobacterium luteum]KFF01723.1 hypothetical protein IX38_16785 [Chryseobacterium luteum]